MVKVKCRFCGKQINKEEAFAVKHGKSNWYYCSFEHSTAKPPKELFINQAFDIIGKTTNTIFYKELKEVSDVHDFEKMTKYLEENKLYLTSVMSKDFYSEFAKIRYFFAIIKNNLGDFKPKEEKLEIVRDADIEFYEPQKKIPQRKSKFKGMDELMGELLDG